MTLTDRVRYMALRTKILYEEGRGEIVEKKSRFIATLRPVSDLAEAMAFVEEMKKQYWDARHNCYAFVIGDNNEISRCSDDGEPSGTAGRPMLEVLTGEEIHNAAVVVTRYFGGVLLGTGGLVRAYQAAVKAGIENSGIIEKTQGNLWEISCDYNLIGKLQYILSGANVIPLDTIYDTGVIVRAALPADSAESIIKAVTEGLNAKVTLQCGEDIDFAVSEGKTIILS